MYRCAACDVPAEFGHRSGCPVTFGEQVPEKMEPQEDRGWWPELADYQKVNVASGEDVALA